MAITKVSSGLISADASSIDLNIDAGTLYLDVSENRVGIGTSSPDEILHVNAADSGNSLVAFTNSTTGLTTEFVVGINASEQAIIYNENNTDMIFATNNDEKMRIDSSGNVGIGISSPNTPAGNKSLHVAGTTGAELILERDDSGVAADDFIGGLAFLNSDASNTPPHYLGITARAFNEFGSSQLEFFSSFEQYPSGTPDMVLDGSGNVGIGVVPYANTLSTGIDLQNGLGLFGYNNGFYLSSNGYYDGAWKYKTSSVAAKINSNSTGDTVFSSAVSGSANGAITWVDNVTIAASGNVGIGGTGTARLVVQNDGNCTVSITSNDGGLATINLGDASDGSRGQIVYDNSDESLKFSTNNLQEKMRIDSSGNLLVGKTATGLATNGFEVLSTGEINSTRTNARLMALRRSAGAGTMIEFFRDSTSVGSIVTATSSTAYNTSSDGRLKDITGKARGLEVINQLNPVSYKWKEDGKGDEGLIAQEVLDIVPNAVSGSEEDMYQMDYSKLVVHLVAGMKEQQTIIDDLKTRIETLENV